MDLGLGGRTALVLGASSGLGLASAEALREEGANVVMLARREETLREHAERLGATAVPGDVRERADLLRTAVSTCWYSMAAGRGPVRRWRPTRRR